MADAARAETGRTEIKRTEMTHAEWSALGRSLFGDDQRQWQFVCPSCGHVASVEDYHAAGAPEGAVGFSCVGRWFPSAREAFGGDGGPCNYSGGGLINLNPVTIDGRRYFRFFGTETEN